MSARKRLPTFFPAIATSPCCGFGKWAGVSQTRRACVGRAHPKSSLHAVRCEPREPRDSAGHTAAGTTAAAAYMPLGTAQCPAQRAGCSSSFGLPTDAADTSPILPSPPSPWEHSLLRFCFLGFDCLRFDWSSSNRFRCGSRRRGGLFLGFVLADS